MESYFRAAQEAVLKEAALRVSDVARVSLGGLDSHRHVERDPARRDAEGPLDERGGRIALLGPLEGDHDVPVPTVSVADAVPVKPQRPGTYGGQLCVAGPGPARRRGARPPGEPSTPMMMRSPDAMVMADRAWAGACVMLTVWRGGSSAGRMSLSCLLQVSGCPFPAGRCHPAGQRHCCPDRRDLRAGSWLHQLRRRAAGGGLSGPGQAELEQHLRGPGQR